MSTVVLEVKNLEKSFRNIKVVNNISFKVEKGDIFGFLGENGAGKTTTIRMILGLLKIDKGDVYIHEKSIKNDFYSAVRKVGALVEGPAFYDYMTAKENLEVFGSYSGRIKKEKIQGLLELVGLKDRENDKVKEYSLGMKQRLGIAQALLNDPELLILDEPINGLDPKGIRDIRNLMFDLSSKGVTILISSHILDEIQHTCNKVLIINKGKYSISGFTKELLDNSNMYDIEATNTDKLVQTLNKIKEVNIQNIDNFVRVKINADLFPEDLLNMIIVNNKIRMFSPVKVSLEDYFFDTLEGQ
jgi:ABC-2 type transport system ATP-binding protein